MRNLFALLLISVFLSCGQVAKHDTNTEVPKAKPIIYTTPAGDKIIFLNDYYSSFLDGVKSGNKNMDSLYRINIQYPILNYFSKCEYSELVKYQFYYSIQDTTGLVNYISLIKNNENKIEKLITSALADANKFLKNDSITVYIQPSDNYMKTITQKMGGITAVTAGSKKILLTVDLSVNSWEDMIKYTIAHEFNHTYWTKMDYHVADKSTLLDYLVFEGRADSYAHFIYPDIKCPWTSALMENDKNNLWNKLKPELDTTDMSLQSQVMFGSDTYPMWGGYTLGYDIVQSTLKNHPELKPVEWANLDPKKILQMSNYK